MKTLILYPDSPSQSDGLLRRLHEQIFGICRSAEEIIDAHAQANSTKAVIEWISYRSITIPSTKHSDAPLHPLSSESSVKLFRSKDHAIEIDDLSLLLSNSDVCLHIAESPCKDSLDLLLSKAGFPSSLPIIRIAPAYPLSFIATDIHLSCSGFADPMELNRLRSTAGTGCQTGEFQTGKIQTDDLPVGQLPNMTLPTMTLLTTAENASTSIEADTSFDYELHYEQFSPTQSDFAYVNREHVLAILTGDETSTMIAVDGLRHWIEENQQSVSGVTLVLKDNICSEQLRLPIASQVIPAETCTLSTLLSLMAKSQNIFTAGNGLYRDMRTFREVNVLFEENSQTGQTLPNSFDAFQKALLLFIKTTSQPGYSHDKTRTSRSTHSDSVRTVIPIFRLSDTNTPSSVSNKVFSMKKKWKKFNESPRRFFADSTSVVSLPFRLARDKHGD